MTVKLSPDGFQHCSFITTVQSLLCCNDVSKVCYQFGEEQHYLNIKVFQDSILQFLFPDVKKKKKMYYQIYIFFYSKVILEIEGLKPGCDCYVHAGKQKMGKQQCDA